MEDSFNLKIIVLTLTIGFALAAILGYLSQRAKLTPLLGYLVAGYLIGPYSPGFVADVQLSEQLAEIGVILMMFGVGLHFKWQDLLNTKNISLPGAIGQTCIATIAGVILIYFLGWKIEAGIVYGFSVAVASTVVLVRVLTDNKLLHLPQGHIAVGWLIVEDIITVVMLLILPTLTASTEVEGHTFHSVMLTLTWLLFKIAALFILMFAFGQKLVSGIFAKISKTNSHELFTLTVLAITFVIAAGAAVFFGVSIALGAFLAGMIMGQTNVHRRVESNALPMRDAFVVVFFISVGMIFNPAAILENFILFICTLAIILILKPLTAFVISRVLNQSFKTSMVVALSLAQIGEFSFILAEEGMKLKILPDEAYDIIVACAIISIALNPLIFRFIKLSSTPTTLNEKINQRV